MINRITSLLRGTGHHSKACSSLLGLQKSWHYPPQNHSGWRGSEKCNCNSLLVLQMQTESGSQLQISFSSLCGGGVRGLQRLMPCFPCLLEAATSSGESREAHEPLHCDAILVITLLPSPSLAKVSQHPSCENHCHRPLLIFLCIYFVSLLLKL